jgi:hypothetical protein
MVGRTRARAGSRAEFVVADRILRVVDRSHVDLRRSGALVDLLAAAGFVGAEARTLHGGGYAIVSARRG